MLLLFIASLVLITAGCAAFHYFIRLNSLSTGLVTEVPGSLYRPHTYEPMTRLLAPADMEFVASCPELHRKLRTRRRQIFRSYLRCLSKEYSRLSGGVRWIMVNSSVDRPDLAKILARQQRQFAFAICRIEWKLTLHALGMENVRIDVSGMVSAVDNLTGIVNVFQPARA